MRRAGDFVVTRDQGDMTCASPAAGATPPLSNGPRPDASFVAHLMAMAEQDSQAPVVRRATGDVDAAYRAAANQNHTAPRRSLRAVRAGFRAKDGRRGPAAGPVRKPAATGRAPRSRAAGASVRTSARDGRAARLPPPTGPPAPVPAPPVPPAPSAPAAVVPDPPPPRLEEGDQRRSVIERPHAGADQIPPTAMGPGRRPPLEPRRQCDDFSPTLDPAGRAERQPRGTSGPRRRGPCPPAHPSAKVRAWPPEGGRGDNSMRGEILEFDRWSGEGLISGEDGVRYGFFAADIQGMGTPQVGGKVDFVLAEGKASNIYVLAGAGPMLVSSNEDLGLWGYFAKCMRLYFNGSGRARRTAYCSFILFR
eukprot:gene37357-50411_t